MSVKKGVDHLKHSNFLACGGTTPTIKLIVGATTGETVSWGRLMKYLCFHRVDKGKLLANIGTGTFHKKITTELYQTKTYACINQKA